jgi:cytochrome c oxidase assembly factor CtaG
MLPGYQAALGSWAIPPAATFALVLTALVYLRGWWLLHCAGSSTVPAWRASMFLAGLLTLWIALASPLDVFNSFLLTAHMLQHMLLMMVAPPLILLGSPLIPLVRGLPIFAAREFAGPFLNWPRAQRMGRALIHPAVALILMGLVMFAWHVPALYELALRSSSWHQTEHACFFLTSLVFWWPVVQPWPSRPQWPRWALVPYLLIGDLQNTALSAALTFSDRILYHSYALAPRLFGMSASEDQIAAGAIMWVVGSVAFVVPGVIIAVQHLSPRSSPAELIITRRRESSSRATLCSALLRIPLVGVFLERQLANKRDNTAFDHWKHTRSRRATPERTGEQASGQMPLLGRAARETISAPDRSRPRLSRRSYGEGGDIRLTRVPRRLEAAWFLTLVVATGLCLARLLGGSTDDDWVLCFTQTSGSFAVTVFEQAGGTSAGPTAFSVLTQNPNTQEVLLDVTANVAAHRRDNRLATSSEVQASSEHSQNRLLQTAEINLATEGPWIVTITLRRNPEIEEFSFPVYVLKPDKRFKIPWIYLLLVAFGLILALVYARRHWPAEFRAAQHLPLHRQLATALARETGNVQLSGLYAYLHKEHTQRNVQSGTSETKP